MGSRDALVGARLAKHRRRRGLSQIQFGDMIGRSESWVSKVETGALPLDSLGLAEKIADLLGLPITHLLALETATSEPVARDGEDAAIRLTHLMVSAQDWEVADATKMRWILAQAASAASGVLEAVRSQAGATPPAEMEQADVELSHRMAYGLAHGAHTDKESLFALEQIAWGYRSAYRSASARSLIGPAHGALLLGIELAAGPDRHRDRVISFVGQLSALIGTMLMLDLGDFTTAKQYLALCIRAARQAEDNELLAFGMGCRAFHAAYSGDPRAGLSFANAGLDVAATGIHPHTSGWLSAVASEMTALAGEGRVCERHLEEAASALEQPEDRPWTGIGVFNGPKLTAYRGGAFQRLGRHRDAQRELTAALESLEPSLTKHRCTAHIDLAEAYIGNGQIDDGVSHALAAARALFDTYHAESLRRLDAIHAATKATRSAATREFGHALIELKAST